MGQRPNAQGYDLNRDHVKLDSPEARALIRLMTEYDPHVGIDLHTTNGTQHAYHITYSAPLNPNTHPSINDLLRNEWLPAADAHLRETHGWESEYYGNASEAGETGRPGWYTFDHRPRFNNNYLGLRNRFAILSEAYAYATFEERVLATRSFVVGAVDFAMENAARIRSVTAEADAAGIVGTRLSLRAVPHAGDALAILMGEVAEVRNPYSGATLLERRDARVEVEMTDYGSFESVEDERVPAMYVVPAEAREVLENLADHGVVLSPLGSSRQMRVQVFRIDSTVVATSEFEGHSERTVLGRYVEETRLIPETATIVRTDQRLGRLIFYLLEPRSDDGLLSWNVLDDSGTSGGEYPIVRVMADP